MSNRPDAGSAETARRQDRPYTDDGQKGEDDKMTLQNLHTHTVFSDGKNTPEEMVLGAVRAGCTSLGFSEHSPLAPFYDPDRYAMEAADLPAYRSEILRLREKYAGQLEVYLGLEQDYDSPAPGPDFDYLIGSVHSVVADGAIREQVL